MSARVTTKKARALALMVVAGVAIYTISTFALASTGQNSANVQPASNFTGGSPFELTSVSTPITRPNGNASIQAGVAIAEIKLIQGYGSRLKVDVAWLDPRDAAQVLNNPNAQIYAGLYHPVSQGGDCPSTPHSVSDNYASIVDGGVHYCLIVDPHETGSLMFEDSSAGSSKLILSPSSISGYIASSLSDPTSTDCTGINNADAWCTPTALTPSEGYSYNVVWLVLTIVTPGGKPAGQQNNINDLSFYTQAKSL